MKKYLLGLLAITMAVGFSAFTNTRPVKESNTTDYFWYELNAAKTQTLGLTVNEDPDVAVDEASQISFYSFCEDGTSRPKCLVGFTSPVSSGTSVTGITDEGRIIREDPL